MDPFSLSTGIVDLIVVALKLVGALGMIDKIVIIESHIESHERLETTQFVCRGVEGQ